MEMSGLYCSDEGREGTKQERGERWLSQQSSALGHSSFLRARLFFPSINPMAAATVVVL